MASNPAIASLLQSCPPAGRVAELGSLGIMESPGIIVWIGALVVLLLYVIRLVLQQPRGQRLALGSYWLLFVVSPLAIFGAVVSFSLSALMGGVVLLVILCVIGERGLRLWSRFFKSVR